jgi:3-deoxy-7-phosphoheptulonate synthase / chorismate mutase
MTDNNDYQQFDEEQHNTSRLKELRNQVDEVNMQLLDLLSKRAQIVSEIGKVHTNLGNAFYDPVREGEMLQALEMANRGPFSNETIKALFREIFRASLDLEEKQAKAKIKVQRKSSDERTVVRFPDGFEIGGGDFTVISGPCAVESVEQMDETAAALASRGVRVLRGMAYKPRTSPYEFQGLGEQGLRIARQVADKYNMYVVTEIMDMSQITMMSDYVDIFWVGARNMQNSFLLKALGQQRKPVILKRSFGATVEEFLYAAEYIVSSGNPNVILIERGIRTFEKVTRATLDIGAVAVLKLDTHLPLIVDISHSAGRRDIAIPLARVAKASGADGLMVEVHPNPPVAMSDSKQQLYIPQFFEMMDAVENIHVDSAVQEASKAHMPS